MSSEEKWLKLDRLPHLLQEVLARSTVIESQSDAGIGYVVSDFSMTASVIAASSPKGDEILFRFPTIQELASASHPVTQVKVDLRPVPIAEEEQRESPRTARRPKR